MVFVLYFANHLSPLCPRSTEQLRHESLHNLTLLDGHTKVVIVVLNMRHNLCISLSDICKLCKNSRNKPEEGRREKCKLYYTSDEIFAEQKMKKDSQKNMVKRKYKHMQSSKNEGQLTY